MHCDIRSAKIYDQLTPSAIAVKGKKSDEERNMKNYISWERKELFRWKKMIFHILYIHHMA